MTLDQHNQQVDMTLQSREGLLGAGVECPQCHAEMRFRTRQQKDMDMGDVRCPKCGHTGYKKSID